MPEKQTNKLQIIKWVHTLVWALFVFLIGQVVYSGITGNISTFTWISIAAVWVEGIVLLIFGMFCPLTVMARKYSNSTRANFDIFLPEWLARHNKLIFTSIFMVGLGLVLYRYFVAGGH